MSLNIIVGSFWFYQIILGYLIWKYEICQISYQWLKKHIVVIAVFALVILFVLTAWFVVGKIHPTFQMAEEIQKALLGQTTINKDYTTTQVEYVKGIFTLIAGLVGILVLMKGFFALDLDREKAQNERFAKAIEHLGDNAIDIRLGGIFALEALMNENPEHFASRVITQLCAYSSNRGSQLNLLLYTQNVTKKDKATPKNKTTIELLQYIKFEKTLLKLQKPPSMIPFLDLQESIRILCKTPHWNEYYNGQPLRLTKLFGVQLNLQNASNLSRADLHESSIMFSNLIATDLTDTYLAGSYIVDTTISSADLSGTILTFSSLIRVDFTESKLFKTNLNSLAIVLNCLFYKAKVNLSQLHQLKKWKCCVPIKGFDIEHLRNNLDDDSLWEQHPETLTDAEVIERLQLIVVDEGAPIPPPSADPEIT